MHKMKVMRFSEPAGAPGLRADTLPIPRPLRGQLLVRVHAVGVTPSERVWYPTAHYADGTARKNAIPGHEFSGAVTEVGEGIDRSEVGSEVFGMNDWYADGATAEYCLTTLESIATKPHHLSHVEAASVPIGALTAWQGLFDRGKLEAGQRLLVHGGAGAVGVWAIQLAHRAGAHVTATGSAGNLRFLAELGADKTVDYRAAPFEKQVHPVDLVFDGVGGETLRRSWDLLRPGGRLVTIAADSETATNDRTKSAFFIVKPDRQQLTEISRGLESRDLLPVVNAILPWSSAATAYDGPVEGQRGRGKIVLRVADLD